MPFFERFVTKRTMIPRGIIGPKTLSHVWLQQGFAVLMCGTNEQDLAALMSAWACSDIEIGFTGLSVVASSGRNGDRMVKKALKIIGCALGALALVVVAYIIYVMATYYRLDDNLTLATDQPENGQIEMKIQLIGAGSTSSSDQTTASDSSGSFDQIFTIVSANLGFGAYGPDFDFFMDGGAGSVASSAQYAIDNVNGSADAIRQLDPDFVLFQEVDIDATRSCGVDEYALLRKDYPDMCSVFAQNYDSAFLAWPLYAPHGKNKAGMATFARYQLDDSIRRSLPISESFSKFLDLDRCYSVSRVQVSNGKQLIIFNVHLSAYGADEKVLEGQRAMLFEDMRSERAAGNYVIAGGDFNHDMIGISNEVYRNVTDVEASWAKPFDFASVPDGFTVAPKAELDAGTFDSAATCRDAGRPYDGTNDRWVMDAFIYSDNITCIDQRTLDLDFMYSDHNPVCLRFSLEE